MQPEKEREQLLVLEQIGPGGWRSKSNKRIKAVQRNAQTRRDHGRCEIPLQNKDGNLEKALTDIHLNREFNHTRIGLSNTNRLVKSYAADLHKHPGSQLERISPSRPATAP